uniref:Uncharacterized protein n=1 Tax=Knipowitschia caucasica TaxID=637954 RepID=A0AAV2KSI2_KNICA
MSGETVGDNSTGSKETGLRLLRMRRLGLLAMGHTIEEDTAEPGGKVDVGVHKYALKDDFESHAPLCLVKHLQDEPLMNLLSHIQTLSTVYCMWTGTEASGRSRALRGGAALSEWRVCKCWKAVELTVLVG